jgi:GNAT superfamily N-acetyltransferase
MIRVCNDCDEGVILDVINDGARAYRGVIPGDRWRDPYMSAEELKRELANGVAFLGYEADGALAGVMGIQPVKHVTLIRHAYVRTGDQKRGIGGQLLSHLMERIDTPVLIGTWADAYWAIHFYEKHGFTLASTPEKDRLLRTYWDVPRRQIEASVVLMRASHD